MQMEIQRDRMQATRIMIVTSKGDKRTGSETAAYGDRGCNSSWMDFSVHPDLRRRKQMAVEPPITDSSDSRPNDLEFHRNRGPRPGEQLLVLLRAPHHIAHCKNERELIDAILRDMVSALDADRGEIVLAANDNQLELCSVIGDSNEPAQFSRALAERCLGAAEGVLCGNEKVDAHIRATEAWIYVPLLTVRRRLGVMAIRRRFRPHPFTEDDLYFANAIATYLSLEIEGARTGQEQSDQ
jgi:GAF domain-containing protein